MEREKLEVGALLGRTWAAMSAAPAATLAYIAVLALSGSYADYSFAENAGVTFLDSIASFVAGFFLAGAMLRGLGLRAEGEGGGFGAYFVVCLLGGLGMLLGFLLFILPGVIVMIRWWPAFAIALSEDRGGAEALGDAWKMTEGQFWPIFGVVLIGLVPLVLLTIAAGAGTVFLWTATDEAFDSTFAIVALNIGVAAYSAYSTATAIAVYSMLRDSGAGLAETFA